MKAFTDEWWNAIQGNQFEKAGLFNRETPVTSILGARIMVIDALKLLKKIKRKKK